MGPDLIQAISSAVSGDSHFSVEAAHQSIRADLRKKCTQYRRRIVFWPFGSQYQEVYRFLAALEQGVVPVMIAPDMPKKKLQKLIADYPNWGKLNEDGSITGSNLSEADPRLLFIAATSGSSGKPKFLAATTGNIEASVSSIHEAQTLENIESTAVWLPFFFNFALINQLFWAVLYQRKLVLLPGMKEAGTSFDIMRKTGAQMICWVNSQARMIQKLGFTDKDRLPDVKQVNFGGSVFPMHYVDYLRTIFPSAELINNYGCTEALSRMSLCRVENKNQDHTYVGKSIRCVRMRIEEGTEEGRLQFTGASKTLGEVLNDGSIQPYNEWVSTGDTGKIKNGQIFVYGRHDQIFKVSGERLSLVEIEKAMLHIQGIENALAWTLPDENGEQAPVVVIQGEKLPGVHPVRTCLRDYIPRRAWPVHIYWTPDWPLTDRGKTDRKKIQDTAVKGKYDEIRAKDIGPRT